MRLLVPMLVFLVGCGVHKRSDPPLDVQPLAFSQGGDAAAPDRFWTAFDDPGLDRAVQTALSDNFDVQAAYGRLHAAEAVVRRERGAWVPDLEGFGRTSIGSADPFEGTQRVPIEIGLQSSYEIDLWGRIGAQIRGEAQRREARRGDAQAAALGVAAEVANTWVALAANQEQLRLLEAQIVSNQQMAEVVRTRFLNGVVRQADTLRQDRLVEQTRAQQIEALQERDLLQHRLAVLLGLPPRAPLPSLPEALPAAPALPSTGVPSELMRRRPDVRAAEHSLYAADADVAVAVTDQFPRFTLRGVLSTAPTSPEALLTGWVASLAASVLAPIFAGGQRRAEVRRTKGLLEAQVATYGGVLLTALREVEDALVRNQRQAETVASLQTQLELAEQTSENLAFQYMGDLGVSYLDVLTARTNAQQLRRQEIDARQRLLEVRIDLYRALAGGLEREEGDG